MSVGRERREGERNEQWRKVRYGEARDSTFASHVGWQASARSGGRAKEGINHLRLEKRKCRGAA